MKVLAGLVKFKIEKSLLRGQDLANRLLWSKIDKLKKMAKKESTPVFEADMLAMLFNYKIEAMLTRVDNIKII